jgi:hypothetical protein
VPFLEEALHLGWLLEDTWSIGFSLFTLGRMALGRGDGALAERYLQECLAVSERTHNTWGVAYMLYMLGFAALVSGNLTRASSLQQDSLEHNRALGNTRGMALCVEMLAIVATKRQQVERAARLFAIADALCDAANYHLPPGVVAFHEQAVAGVKAVLGAREFGDAWAGGRRLPLEEGVAFAMGAGVPRRRSAGNTPELSRREMQVVQLVAEG